ncbi:MAG: N-acyl homoserine lactonase family protein [Gammaproteobacteria bacterium]|nr:N-acyl homoserine lactonase family protein [Gammaproteobacteria bacterium]
MTQVRRFWPILTGTHRYDKSLSTRGRGQGTIIEAPILAYLIETANGRILYDVGCDYRKIVEPGLRKQYYENPLFPFGPPEMTDDQRLPQRLARLGLRPEDVDLVFLGHLHFDHGGGLADFRHAEVHVQARELAAARELADDIYFLDDFNGDYRWHVTQGEYELVPGVRAIESPGHTAGHMSLLVELPEGAPILIAGDAADLKENLDQEIAPGLCWHDREDLAVNSIRRLKQLARDSRAELWPNHDMDFYRSRQPFPAFYK